jgi:hypothetical protein
MIVEKPSERNVRELAEFVYGNGVPFEVAVECFDAFNGGCVLFVEEMNSFYEEVNSDPFMLHKALCYSMQLKAMAWINEWACNRLEPV